MEYLHEVLLSPFWTTLLEQQQEQSQQQTAVRNNVVATPSSSTSSASTTLPADGSELDVLIVDDDEATDSAALACGIFSVEASSAEEVWAGGVTVPVQQASVPASEVGDALTEKNVLQKYQVHSVLTELRKLFQQKAALSNSVVVGGAAPGMVPAATVLDVTRLKRAMVHHTKKYAGYRYAMHACILFFIVKPSTEFIFLSHHTQSARCAGISFGPSGRCAK